MMLSRPKWNGSELVLTGLQPGDTVFAQSGDLEKQVRKLTDSYGFDLKVSQNCEHLKT